MSGEDLLHETADPSRDTSRTLHIIEFPTILDHIGGSCQTFCQIARQDSLPVIDKNGVYILHFLRLLCTEGNEFQISGTLIQNVLSAYWFFTLIAGDKGNFTQLLRYFDQFSETSIIFIRIIGNEKYIHAYAPVFSRIRRMILS